MLLTIGAVTAGVLTTAGYLISPDTVRSEVLNRIRAATGLDPKLGGKVSVSLFPKGSVSFSDVVLGDPNRPALSAERLTARLRFFPLLVGKVEIADVSLEKPTIAIDVDRDGRSNWSALIGALAQAQKPRADRSVAGFSEMRIDDGTVILRKDDGRVAETLYAVDLSLAWPSISKSFGATGHFVWHGEKIDASVALADFAAALAGTRSGVKLRLSSGTLMKAAFEGAFSLQPTVKVEGTLAADAVSLRRAMTWAGHEPLPGGGFGRFAIKGQTTIVGDSISLSGVNVELDGNSAEGVLAFSSEGRQTLQGTLAADTLDLTPYISTIRLTANQRDWSDTQLKPDGLNGLEFDLRLSAANVIMGSAKFGRTAVGANLRTGKLTVSVGEALAYGGVIKGSLALTNADSGVDLKSQLQFVDVDLEACLGQLFGLKRIEGRGTMSMALDGAGDSVLAMTRTLAGTATLTGQDGAVNGINVEQLLKRLERRPLSGGGEFRSGRTPFDKIEVNLRVAQGMIDVQALKVESSAIRLALAGTASVPDREFDLKGTAALVVASRAGAAPFGLPFVVQGPWEDPIMLPDTEALIRRSGAAAPLLNAVRERNARDTVRSAIERLTGSGTPPAAEAAPAEPKP